MEEKQDGGGFMQALRTMMIEGGFMLFDVYTKDESDPDGILEAIILGRDRQSLELLSMKVLTAKSKAVN